MEFQLSYFKSFRWCCESAALNMPANLENSAVATGLEKVSLHSNSKERKCQKKCSNHHTVALISHASKVMLKILQPGFSNTWTMNFLMFKLVLEKAEESEIKLPPSDGSSKKQEFQKNICFCFIGASLVAQRLKHLSGMQETWVWSLGGEDPLEKGLATHSSILPWEFHGQRSLVRYI